MLAVHTLEHESHDPLVTRPLVVDNMPQEARRQARVAGLQRRVDVALVGDAARVPGLPGVKGA